MKSPETKEITFKLLQKLEKGFECVRVCVCLESLAITAVSRTLNRYTAVAAVSLRERE